MKTILTIGTMLLAIAMVTDISAQGWRFPDCRDLFITKVEVPISAEDKLYITVTSQCDTCQQHVYTGLRVHLGADTLAVEDLLFSKPSPDNNAAHRYALTVQSPFEFSESLRVEMVAGLCDSLSFGTDWITSTEEVPKLTAVKVFPNPSNGPFQIRMTAEVEVKAAFLYDSGGRILQQWAYLPSELNLEKEASGVFWLLVDTNKGIVRQRLIRL